APRDARARAAGGGAADAPWKRSPSRVVPAPAAPTDLSTPREGLCPYRWLGYCERRPGVGVRLPCCRCCRRSPFSWARSQRPPLAWDVPALEEAAPLGL